MNVVQTSLPGVLIFEPKVFGDTRGFFYESFNETAFRQATNLDARFVQDNHSRSSKNVLRGLHYQLQQAQGKLVRVTTGAVFDVAVDVRKSSPHFGQWFGIELNDDNKRQLWIPPGFAHGFLVLSEYADFLYKTTDFYAPSYEQTIAWDDPTIGIQWPLEGSPLVSSKDSQGASLGSAKVFL
jgi:dTDP-4-dehydrorhamnose 3,5-epimerase